jgi:hypothetical protein
MVRCDIDRSTYHSLLARGLAVTLDDLNDALVDHNRALKDEVTISLDRETRQEMAFLLAAFDGDTEELLRRGVHRLFRSSVDRGDLDFHLRGAFDVTYDEYLVGMTYDDAARPDRRQDDDRRYRQ